MAVSTRPPTIVSTSTFSNHCLVTYHLVKPFSVFSLAMKRLIGWHLEPIEYSFPNYLYALSNRN